MANAYKGRKIGVASVVGAVLSLAVVTSACQAPASEVPRMPDGKPNLNGIWQAVGTAHWDLEDHPARPSPYYQLGALGAAPAGQGVVEGGKIPYKPEALAKKQENFAKRWSFDGLTIDGDPTERESIGDPELKCYLPGIPRATYMPYPFQITQTRDDILMAYEFASANRVISMEPPTEGPIETWMGYSFGRWEGDTLVVDTRDSNGNAWLDRAGNFISSNAQIVERFTPTGPDHLSYEVTIDDPDVFTRPWKISMPLYRRVEKNLQLMEFKCVEFAEELLYHHLRKQPSADKQAAAVGTSGR